MPIRVVTQQSVMIDHEPGALRRLTDALASAGVNLTGITTLNLGAKACVKIIAPKGAPVRETLHREGFKFTESQAFEIELEKMPFALNELLIALARRGANVTSCYGHNEGGSAKVVVTVDKHEQCGALVLQACEELGASELSYA